MLHKNLWAGVIPGWSGQGCMYQKISCVLSRNIPEMISRYARWLVLLYYIALEWFGSHMYTACWKFPISSVWESICYVCVSANGDDENYSQTKITWGLNLRIFKHRSFSQCAMVPEQKDAHLNFLFVRMFLQLILFLYQAINFIIYLKLGGREDLTIANLKTIGSSY